MKKVFLTAMAAVLLAAGILAANEKAQTVKQKKQANAAYDFSLKTTAGKTVKLSDFKGKVVILNFWATWCPPCKAEIPSFIGMYKKYEKDGLVIVGVAVDDPAKVAQFVKDNGVNYPVVIADQTTVTAYGGVRGIPTTFVIDKNGSIVRNYTGYRPEAVFLSDFNSNK